MKNHTLVNGRLLQTNKKWSHLKEAQKRWIIEVIQEEYTMFINANQRIPNRTDKELIVETVYRKIEERSIWIPFHEVKERIYRHIARLNRKLEAQKQHEI